MRALQEGYYKDEIQKKEKKLQHVEQQNIQSLELEKEKQEINEKLIRLKSKYLSNEFIEGVLEKYTTHFLYNLMLKDYQNGKINKFLQAFIDRELLNLEQ